MEGKNFVYTLVVIFIAGLFLGGFLTGGVTGYYGKNTPTTISITPKEIITGHTGQANELTIQIVPGSKGAEVIYELRRDSPYLSDEKDPKMVENQWCRGYDDFGNAVIKTGSGAGSKCFSQKTFTYTFPVRGFFEEGGYYVNVYDFATKGYVKAYFVVTEYGTTEFGDSRS